MKKYIIIGAILTIFMGMFYKKVYILKHTFKTITPKIGDMMVKINGVGNVGSENIYKISALYGGKVYDFNIKVGDFIKKGQLIAKIDSVDLIDKIKELQQNIKVIKENINSLIIDKKSAYNQYLYLADVLRKNTQLYKKNAISELEYKKYQTDTLVSDLKVKSLDKKILSLQNQILQLQANINGLYKKLKKYTIVSDVDGYVIKKYISNFDVIGNNQPLIEIVNPKDVWIDTFIDTRISGEVKLNNKSFIKLRSNLKTDGYVYKINPVNNIVTNEREIFIKFNKLPIPFYLNEQAVVDINVKKLKNITKIPPEAIVVNNKKYGVWILKNNRVHFQPIKIIAYGEKMVAIKNLNETIVLPNPKNISLKEGMKIYYD